VAANPQPVPGQAPRQAPSGFLRDEQYAALAQATAEIGVWLRTLFELGVTYGIGKGQLLGLQVRQINLEEQLIMLNPGGTKNGLGRNLRMTSIMFELISELIRGKAPEDYVFTRERTRTGHKSRNGGRIVEMREEWRQATEAAGCPGLLFRYLRRTGRDPEKHRASSKKSYHANRSAISQRRKERRDRERAAKGIVVDPADASRMGAMREAPRHVLQQPWTQNLFAKIDSIIAKNIDSRHTRKNLRCAFRLILTRAEKDRLTEESEITPAWLAFPRQTKDRRKEPMYRASFARMLVRLDLWSQEDYALFQQNAQRSFGNHIRHLDAPKPKPAPAPPVELCQLVREMAYRCGLSMAQMQELRVAYIEADGLRIPPTPKSEKLGRLIPFGTGWDELPKTVLDTYVRKENPNDYLFFSRSPRDKSKPLSTMTLNGAVIESRTTIEALCILHFDQDFKRARSLQEARFHLRNVHGLDNQYVHSVIARSKWHRGYANETDTIPVPEPYLLAAMCASRSVAEDQAKLHIPEGGKRCLITWRDLFGYEITIDWTRSFAKELSGRGEKGARAFRLLCRLAFDFWFVGRRMKLPDIENSEIRREDKDLLREFAATRVIVRHSQGSWEGSLFEYGTRKRSFRIPLIEEMNGRAWHNQCQICWHPEREGIEREISATAIKNTRRKGYHLIASKYGVSDQSLKGHSGRRVPRPGRGETQRSHFSTGFKAPILRCPRRFFEQLQNFSAMDLMIYSLLLLEFHRADTPSLFVCTESIERRLDLRLDDSQLSLALNHLGPTGLALVDFKRDPKGFYVELLRSLTKSTSLAA
jgi:hypothetical protein